MYKTVDKKQFQDELKDRFSPEAIEALWEYLYYEEKATGVENDIDNIKESYKEYHDFQDFRLDYPEIYSLEELEEETDLIEVPHSSYFIVYIAKF